ncbi:MAG: S9 family peptidase, partial [Acidobacteria bacterium]|nr:S9 family peptidase [Acidobacteriota bacterium]
MKRITILLVIPLLIVASATTLEAQKRMTIEDALAIHNVGGPQFSPDGKWLAYTVSDWDRENDRMVSHVYLISSDGGRPIKLSNGEKGESSPQWAPDSSEIAFLADRDKGNQIWRIRVGGGEAEKLTSEENPVSAFRWAPDGKRIAFITRDIPANKAEREKQKKDKFDMIVVEKDLVYSHLWTIDVESKAKKRVTEGSFTVQAPRWSPDGKWIAYVESRNGSQESAYFDISDNSNTDIFIVSSEGGTPRKITSNAGPDSSPAWSPDSKWIAYTTSPEQWAAKTDIAIVSADGASPRNLTKNFSESAGSFQWSPDGTSIYFSSGVGTYNHIFNVATTGGAPKQITRGNRLFGQFDVAKDGRIAFTSNDSKSPDDIFISVGGDNPRQLTTHNPQVKDFGIANSEVIRWKGPGNLDIEGVLIRPLDYQQGRRYPLILQIHGGPYGKFNHNFNSRSQIFAANGYAVLMPNPRGSTGYGSAFTLANVGDWGGRDFQDIMAGVDEAVRMGIADPEKLVVMGGSYGGFMTFWTVSQTDRFKAAIGHAGISDWYS